MAALRDGPAEKLVLLIGQFAAESLPSLTCIQDALHISERELRSPGALREIFMTLPIEGTAFRSQHPSIRGGRDGLLTALGRWFPANDRDDLRGLDQLIVGSVGFLMLTLHGLAMSEGMREGVPPNDPAGRTTDCCGPLVLSRSVRAVLELVYQDDVGKRAHKRWRDAAKHQWEFHRHGSTSILVRVVGDTPAEDLALKLVLAPCLRIREIRDATRSYARRYRIPPAPQQAKNFPHLVDIKASTERWILMTFVHGITLAEVIASKAGRLAEPKTEGRLLTRWRHILAWFRLRDPAAPAAMSGLVDTIRLEDMRRVGLRLFAALEDNWEVNRHARAAGIDRPLCHGDLSPSNVIVEDNAYVFVDYGPNYLYARAAGSGSAAESVFVAPEVRRNEENTDLADLYSLAQIVILAGGLRPDPRGIVPDALYMWHPTVARLLEDYLDAQPAQRLCYSGRAGSGLSLEDLIRLRAQFLFEFDMAIAYQKDPGVVASRWPQLLVEQRLWNGEPRRNRLLLKEVETWPAEHADDEAWARDVNIGDYVDDEKRQLKVQRGWSLAAAGATTLATTFVVWWLLRDIDGSTDRSVLEAILGIVDPPKLPLIDGLQTRGYKVPQLSENWPARVVALSYALLAAKVYHSLYARISPLRARGTPGFGGSSVVATAWIRAMPMLNAVLVLWVTLFWVGYWPIAVIIGQVLAAVGNIALLGFIKRALTEARRPYAETSDAPRVSTVPTADSEITGLDLVASWVPSSLFFALLCAVVGTLIMFDRLNDIWLYASIVAFLNLGLLYAVKCGRNGPKMRVALHRATFAAERLKSAQLSRRADA